MYASDKELYRIKLHDHQEYILETGCILKTVKDCSHGDVMTTIARHIPAIPADTEVEFIKVWRNFYGTQVAVLYNDRQYDLEPWNLSYVRRVYD